MAIAWVFWIGALIILSAIFWKLWTYATKIETLEAEEQQWMEYLDQMWLLDPYNYQYYHDQFEQKFYR